MPSIITNTKVQGVVAGVLVVAFMLAGLYFGVFPDAIDAGTFGDVLRVFAKEPQTKMIVTAILIDVVTGIIAALRVGTFDGQRTAAFMATNVLPYVLGYMLFWFLSYFGLADLVPIEIAGTIANFGFGAVMTSLTKSIIDNLTRAYAGSVQPSDVQELNAASVTPPRG